MISKTKLQQAVDQNLLQQEQLEPLYRFLTDSSKQATQTEEPLRFIRSFGDVFITIGIVLLVLAINKLNLSGYGYLIPALGFVFIAEWLVRIRKLALPGIAILLAILYFINKGIDFNHEDASTFGLAVLSGASLLFYLRYRMPFSLFPLTAGIVAIIVIQVGLDVLENPSIFIALGLLVFIVALIFDANDTQRSSHLSDSAFWLHLLAAPLMVHGSMATMFLSDHAWIDNIGRETIMLIFFGSFFVLALFLDRRALLISTQLYAIYALTRLIENQLSQTENIIIYLLMGMGIFVIFFGAFWYKTRQLLFGSLRNTQIARFVPDFDISDTQQ